MTKLNSTQIEHLNTTFQGRVTFDDVERMLYGHDIAAMPSLIKPLIGNTIPDAVVQPATEEELAGLVPWAAKNRIPLTPRGKASSGYGGVLPVKQGIVVDFYRMKKILSIDAATADRHRPARHRLGEARPRAEEAGADPAHSTPPAIRAPPSAAGWPRAAPASARSRRAGFGTTSCRARVVLPDGTVKDVRGRGSRPDQRGGGDHRSHQRGHPPRPAADEELEVVAIGCPNAPRPPEADAGDDRRETPHLVARLHQPADGRAEEPGPAHGAHGPSGRRAGAPAGLLHRHPGLPGEGSSRR